MYIFSSIFIVVWQIEVGRWDQCPPKCKAGHVPIDDKLPNGQNEHGGEEEGENTVWYFSHLQSC